MAEKMQKNGRLILIAVLVAAALVLIYIRIWVYPSSPSGRTVEEPVWEVAETRFEGRGVFLKVKRWPSNQAFSALKEEDFQWVYLSDLEKVTEEKDGDPVGKGRLEGQPLLCFEFGSEDDVMESDGIKARAAKKAWMYP